MIFRFFDCEACEVHVKESASLETQMLRADADELKKPSTQMLHLRQTNRFQIKKIKVALIPLITKLESHF